MTVGSARLARVLAAAVAGVAVGATTAAGGSWGGSSESAPPRDELKTIRAVFAERSYAAGERAVLSVRAPIARARLTIFRAGPEHRKPRRADVMLGVPVTALRVVALGGARTVSVPLGSSWPSGFYFARLEGADGYLGFAPLIVRPRRLGRNRVAVVFPTNTWQAYNFRDVDGNGEGDTWYANPRIPCVDLSRPYLDRGVPSMRFRGFLRWFEHGKRHADFLSDDDLGRLANGDELARRYDFVLFASHEEYVTEHVYDVVERFRDLGGNLAFLSANTFFYRVERRGERMCRTGLWYGLGRVDARLTGVHYVGWWQNRYPSRPYTVRGAEIAPWLFRGTGLRNGDTFGGKYGVEIDMVSKDSPPGTKVLAEIKDQFGRGRSAHMAYYETKRGAKVFAAGAFGLEAPQTHVHTLVLDNLWAHLVRP
jgi:hypothetical protein